MCFLDPTTLNYPSGHGLHATRGGSVRRCSRRGECERPPGGFLVHLHGSRTDVSHERGRVPAHKGAVRARGRWKSSPRACHSSDVRSVPLPPLTRNGSLKAPVGSPSHPGCVHHQMRADLSDACSAVHVAASPPVQSHTVARRRISSRRMSTTDRRASHRHCGRALPSPGLPSAPPAPPCSFGGGVSQGGPVKGRGGSA